MLVDPVRLLRCLIVLLLNRSHARNLLAGRRLTPNSLYLPRDWFHESGSANRFEHVPVVFWFFGPWDIERRRACLVVVLTLVPLVLKLFE